MKLQMGNYTRKNPLRIANHWVSWAYPRDKPAHPQYSSCVWKPRRGAKSIQPSKQIKTPIEDTPCHLNRFMKRFLSFERMEGLGVGSICSNHLWNWETLASEGCNKSQNSKRQHFQVRKLQYFQREFQDPKMEVLYHKTAIYWGDIPLHRPEK